MKRYNMTFLILAISLTLSFPASANRINTLPNYASNTYTIPDTMCELAYDRYEKGDLETTLYELKLALHVDPDNACSLNFLKKLGYAPEDLDSTGMPLQQADKTQTSDKDNTVYTDPILVSGVEPAFFQEEGTSANQTDEIDDETNAAVEESLNAFDKASIAQDTQSENELETPVENETTDQNIESEIVSDQIKETMAPDMSSDQELDLLRQELNEKIKTLQDYTNSPNDAQPSDNQAQTTSDEHLDALRQELDEKIRQLQDYTAHRFTSSADARSDYGNNDQNQMHFDNNNEMENLRMNLEQAKKDIQGLKAEQMRQSQREQIADEDCEQFKQRVADLETIIAEALEKLNDLKDSHETEGEILDGVIGILSNP